MRQELKILKMKKHINQFKIQKKKKAIYIILKNKNFADNLCKPKIVGMGKNVCQLIEFKI